MTIKAVPPRFSVDPTDEAFVQNPYPTYDAMRTLGPAFLWEQYGFVCCAGYDEVTALLRDRRFGREILHVASRASLGWPEPEPHLAPFFAIDQASMLAREPPVHTRLRTLVNRAFVSRQVERLRPRITALAHELIDRFSADGVDLIPAFATPIPVILIAELLGVPADMTPQLLDWSHRMVAMYQFNRSRAVEDAAVAATQAFVDFLRGYVVERRSRPHDDLISHLIAAEAAGDRLSEDEMIAACILLLNAGHEATVHTIGNSVKAIVEAGFRPQSPAEVERMVEEAMRFDAPLHMFTRYALEEVTVCGFPFKQGDEIGLLLGAANRDPKRYADPHRFWPGRPAIAHTSFGGGIHFCIGAPLARLELQVALPILFERLPGLRLNGAPRYSNTYHFHGLEALDVVW